MLKIPFPFPLQSEQPTKKSEFDFHPATPSLSDVSSVTASSQTALLVIVAHAGSASSHESPPDEMALNCTVAIGATEVGSAEGDAVVGVDGAEVVGAAVGPQMQRHWSESLHPKLEVSTVLNCPVLYPMKNEHPKG